MAGSRKPFAGAVSQALRDAEQRCARLEADRIRLEAILQGSREAIWTWNTDGIIDWWNAAAEKFLGYTADEIVGQSLLKLVRLDRHEPASRRHRIRPQGRVAAWTARRSSRNRSRAIGWSALTIALGTSEQSRTP